MLQKITALLKRLGAELPPGTATLRVYQVPRGSGSVVELEPTNRAAAEFGVVCDDVGLYNFSFGALSNWDFPYERRYKYDEKDILTEVEEMSRAIIAGRCEETRRWFCMTGRIYVEGHTYEMTNLPMLPRPPFGTRRYQPYVQSP
jgi:hypothetical protein